MISFFVPLSFSFATVETPGHSSVTPEIEMLSTDSGASTFRTTEYVENKTTLLNLSRSASTSTTSTIEESDTLPSVSPLAKRLTSNNTKNLTQSTSKSNSRIAVGVMCGIVAVVLIIIVALFVYERRKRDQDSR